MRHARSESALVLLLDDRIRMNKRVFWISAVASVLSALVLGYSILDGWIAFD